MGRWRQTHLPCLLPLFLFVLIRLSTGYGLGRLRKGPSVEDADADAGPGFPHHQRAKICREVPTRILRQVMGSTYNQYYMSVDEPVGFSGNTGRDNVYKRSDGLNNRTISTSAHPFFVPEDLEVVLSEEPAWKFDYSGNNDESPWETSRSGSTKNKREEPPHFPTDERQNVKRSAPPPDPVLDAIAMSEDSTRFEWHCKAPLRWMDLGRDYFPRYLLSVDCGHYYCRGERFKCEPRSFAIKVLRRREGVCAPGFNPGKDFLRMGSDQMPNSLRELWVWEMRAVTFCCVCSLK